MSENNALDVLTERLRTVRSPWRVGLDLGGGREFIVDGTAGVLTARGGTDVADCDVAVKESELLMLLSGKLDVRMAFLFRQAALKGAMRPAVETFDTLAGKDMAYTSSLPRFPAPTTDMSVAQRDLDEAGYCLIKDALNPTQLERLRHQVEHQATREAETGVGYFEGNMADGSGGHPIQRLYALMNKGDVFIELMDHPLIEEFLPQRLGRNYVLSTFFCILAGPGGVPMALHYDQSPIMPTLRDFVVGYNIVFFINEFTAANGATRVMPGSHLDSNRTAPADIFSIDGTVAAEGPAGTALIFDSRLWHGTGPNRTEGARRGLFMYYVRPWMRTTENWQLSVHPSVYERLSDQQRARLGYRHTDGLGRVQGSYDGAIVKYDPESLVLEL
jgi:ectoine hydroxylase-related dioxygenase (phytanoyl-CoA dioxygenase family)